MNTQSTQRFVSDVARPRIASCRDAPQRNDLLVTSRLAASHRIASQLTSTQRFVSDIAPRRYASRLGSTHGTATQLNDLLVTPLRSAPFRFSSQRTLPRRNSTICLLRRFAPQRYALLCCSTQRFVYYDATRLMALLRSSALLNSTICLLPTHLPRVAPPQVAPPRVSTRRFVFDSAPQLGTTKRNSTQRNR